MAPRLTSFRDYMASRVKEYYEQALIGRDFFTAPELDRTFGYAVAESIYELLKDYESPTLLELGAGNGTLAYDILHYYLRTYPEFYQRLSYYIYDFSPSLIDLQKRRLRSFEGKVFWVQELFPLEGVVFSNEFFDCLPVHVVKGDKELFLVDGQEVWLELDKDEVKAFLKRMGYDGLPYRVEVCLECVEFLKKVAQNIRRGYHLVIDYGYTSDQLYRFPEGTVVGYKKGKVVGIKEDQSDLSAWVNFSALEEYGKDFGLETLYIKNLRDFLLSSGVFMKELEHLSLSEKPEDIERLSRLKTMLLSMGDRFKVMLQKKLQNP